MKRASLSIVVYIVLVFLSGVLIGSIGAGLYNRRSVSARASLPSPEELRQRYAEELRTRLKLQPGQIQKLSAILDETHERFRKLHEKYWPEVKAIQDVQVQQIRSILNSSQLGEYEKMREERERERQLRERR